MICDDDDDDDDDDVDADDDVVDVTWLDLSKNVDPRLFYRKMEFFWL